MREHLFNTRKITYIRGDKPGAGCILCALRDRDPELVNLEVCRSERLIVTVNLYPFNPGHVMIFPSRHILSIGELSDEEALEMHRMASRITGIIQEEYSPSGFNVGYNLGRGSGASIEHLHMHIVPRYENEVGFLDVLAGARVVVVDPVEVMERLRRRCRE
jgi:ATP adenylyltransferase